MPYKMGSGNRVVAGCFFVFLAYILGGCLGCALFPESESINKIETIASKISSSVAVMITASILRLSLFRSLKWSLMCLIIIVTIVLLLTIYLFECVISFINLYHLLIFALNNTWNVVIAFTLGITFTELCIKEIPHE